MILTPFNANAFHAIMAILCVLVGLALGAGGYRFHRIAMPMCALFIGGDYAATVISTIADGFGQEAEYWVAFFFGSFPFVAAAMYRVDFGVAVTGFCTGVVLTMMMLNMSEFEGSPTVMVVWMTITGLLVGMLTLKTEKPGMVVSTSFAGAYVLLDGIRHFVNKHLVSEMYEEEETSSRSRSSRIKSRRTPTYSLAEKMRSAWWTMCVISLILFAVFIGVQYFVTALGIDHSTPHTDKADDKEDENTYVGADTPSGSKGQLAPATNPVALV